MATVIKCDRCGSVYKKNTKLCGAALLRNVAVLSAQQHRVSDYDLCDGCFEDFFNFMNAFNKKEAADEMS